MLRVNALRFALLLGALVGGATAASGRETTHAARPEPFRRGMQVVLVEDVIGQYLRINDTTYFVRDLRMARLADGTTAYVSFDLEDDAGERFRRQGSMADLPEGSVEAFTLDDAFGLGGRMLWWADESGAVQGTNLARGEQLVGPGGTVALPGPPRCTLVAAGYCLPNGCVGQCEPFPSCRCIRSDGTVSRFTSCPARGSHSCDGRCGVGSCAHEPVEGGCTCQ